MLKIKDNLDLKELENFGFITESSYWSYCLTLKNENYKTIIYIDKEERIISIENDNYDNNYEVPIPNVVYNLIKVDFVEEVSND